MSLATIPQPFIVLGFFFFLMSRNGHFYDTNMKILDAGARMHSSVVVACAVAFKAFSYDQLWLRLHRARKALSLLVPASCIVLQIVVPCVFAKIKNIFRAQKVLIIEEKTCHQRYCVFFFFRRTLTHFISKEKQHCMLISLRPIICTIIYIYIYNYY